MTTTQVTWLLSGAGLIISLLFTSNLYFITRLINKLDLLDDKVTKTIPAYRSEVSSLAQSVSNMKATVDSILMKLNELAELEAKVAVLEFALSNLSCNKMDMRCLKHANRLDKTEVL